MKVHNFQDSLAREKEESAKLDSLYSDKFHILQVPLEVDKKGIDRVFICKDTYMSMTVEYKNDWRASDTGNAFLELCSVHQSGECKKPGWIYTCQAEMLFYHIPDHKVVYEVDPKWLKQMIPTWEGMYKKVPARNPGYSSIGLLVPLEEIQEACSVENNYGDMV